MADEFDAYQELLGIPPERQPPNYYDLVGVAWYEGDADVITKGAEQQLAKLQQWSATVTDEEILDRLTGRIETAQACLLDPEKKRPYDEKLRLRQRTRGTPASVSAAPPPPAKPTIQKLAIQKSAKTAAPVQSKSKRSRVYVIVFAVLAIVGVAGLIIGRASLRKDVVNTPAVDPTQIATIAPPPQIATIAPQKTEEPKQPPAGGFGEMNFGGNPAPNSGKPISVAAAVPAAPIVATDFRVFLQINSFVARVAYRIRPEESWTPVEIPTRTSSEGFGLATSNSQPTDHRPPSVGPNQPVILLTNLVAGELKLEIQALDKDDKELARIDSVYAVSPNPWKDLRQVAVLSHGGWVEAVQFAPRGNLLVRVQPIEIVARNENAERNNSLTAAQLVAQRIGGLAPLTQCVLWNPEGWKIESTTAVFGLLGTSFEESGTLLFARLQRKPGTEPIQESILWEQGASTSTLVEKSVDLEAVEIAPGGTIIAVASRESVRMLNSGNGELLHTFELGNLTAPPVRKGLTNSRSGSRPGGITASSSRFEGMATMMGSGKNESVPRIESAPRLLTFSDEGKLLALTDGQTPQVIVWDWPERKRLQTLTAKPQSLAIQSTSSKLAIGVANQLQLWNIATGKMVWELPINAFTLAFQPQGDCLAVGVQNKIVLLRTEDGALLRELNGHDGIVSALAFSSDGAWLVSGASDKTVRVWRSTTEAAPLLSQAAPKLIASHLLYIDQLIEKNNFGAALDALPLVYQAAKAADSSSPLEQLMGKGQAGMAAPGSERPGRRSPSTSISAAAVESFSRWIEDGRYKTLQNRLDLVVKDQLDEDLRARFDQIIQSLAEIMRTAADEALKTAAQLKGQEKLQAEFVVFRDFPSALLPKSFADEQQRQHVARRDFAQKVLDKFPDRIDSMTSMGPSNKTSSKKQSSKQTSSKLSSVDRTALERIVNLEFFLPEEAAAAKRLLGTK